MTLRDDIMAMPDSRYLRAARRAASAAAESAEALGIEPGERISWILGATDEELIASRPRPERPLGLMPIPGKAKKAQALDLSTRTLQAQVISECLGNAAGSLMGTLGALSNALEYLQDEPAGGEDVVKDLIGTIRIAHGAAFSEARKWADYARAREKNATQRG